MTSHDFLKNRLFPYRFLLIQTAFTGDVILATPLIEKLRVTYPNAGIDLLLRKGTEGLFDGHPYIRELFIWDKMRFKYLQLFSIIKRIRRKEYDCCINLQRHCTTGIITLLSDSRETVGFTMNPFSRFFTRRFIHRIQPESGRTHEVDLYLQLLGGFVTDTGRIPPRLYPSISDRTPLTVSAPYITIAPASIRFTRQYPADKWIDVINRIPKTITVFLIGGAADTAKCQHIQSAATHPNVKNLAGHLSFLQSAALMKGARMNFTNDSSPLHIASAVDAPVTALFCSTVPRFGYGPLGSNAMVIETGESLPCRPCGPHGHRHCPKGHFRCSNIEASKLVERVFHPEPKTSGS